MVLSVLGSNCVVGFYFTFDDKFHPGARAYLCKVGDIHRRLELICPLGHLVSLMQSPPDKMVFPSSEITSVVFTKNMVKVACIEKNIKPHSLTYWWSHILQSTDWTLIFETISPAEKLINARKLITVPLPT